MTDPTNNLIEIMKSARDLAEAMRPLTQNQPYSWRVFARAIEAKLKEKNR